MLGCRDDVDLGRGALDVGHRAAGGGKYDGRGDERDEEERAEARDETQCAYAKLPILRGSNHGEVCAVEALVER